MSERFEKKFLKLIQIPNLTNLRNLSEIKIKLEHERSKIQNEYLQQIKILEQDFNHQCPTIDIFKKYFDSVQSDKVNNLEKFQTVIQQLLPNSQNDIFGTILPFLKNQYDIYFAIEEQEIIKKEVDQQPIHDAEKQRKFDAIETRHVNLKENRKNIKLNDISIVFRGLLQKKDWVNIKKINYEIYQWKIPKLSPLIDELKVLEANLFELKSGNQKEGIQELKSKIKSKEEQIQEYDLSTDKILGDLMAAYEVLPGTFSELKTYFNDAFAKNAPINLIDGKTLFYGNKFLSEFFLDVSKSFDVDDKFFVVSVIGAQSSAKSTLLNYLFGCGFQTSDGRCTTGLYCSVVRCQKGINIIVIDTEGLLSVVARDHLFDNRISVMAFTISHVVIINNKGELTSTLKDLIEVTIYSMKVMNRKGASKTRLIFSLRDFNSDDKLTQSTMVKSIRENIEAIADKLNVKIDDNVIFSEKDVYLFPNAFQNETTGNKVIKKLNDKFAFKILELRKDLYDYLFDIKDQGQNSLEMCYNYGKDVWTAILTSGHYLLNSRSLLERQIKVNLENLRRNIVATFRNQFFDQFSQLMKNELDKLIPNDESFKAELQKICDDLIKEAGKEFLQIIKGQQIYGNNDNWIQESIEEIKKDLYYTKSVLVGHFLSDYNDSIKKKEFESMRHKLEINIHDTIEKSSNQDIESQIIIIEKKYEEEILKQDLEYKKEILQVDEYLSGHISWIYKEILGGLREKHIFQAVKTFSSFDIKSLGLPIIISKNGKRKDYVQPGFFINIKRIFIDPQKKISEAITKYQMQIISDVNLDIIDPDIIKKIWIKSFNQIEDIAQNINIKLIWSDFCSDLLQIAAVILFQNGQIIRKKYLENELAKKMAELRGYFNGFKNLVKSMKDSYSYGYEIANQNLENLTSLFIKANAALIQRKILRKIMELIPDPEVANKLAYKNSFGKKDFINVYKYCADINKYIEEIYNKKIQNEIKLNIDSSIQKLILDFNQLLKNCSYEIEELKNVEIQSYADFIKNLIKNHELKIYFEQFIVNQHANIANSDQFINGYLKSLAYFKSNKNLSIELQTQLEKSLIGYFSKKWIQDCGCQARCPICKSKCMKKNDNHSQHKVSSHTLAGFGGVEELHSNKVILHYCFSSILLTEGWIWEGKDFNNFDEVINDFEPKWRDEFPTSDEEERFENNIPTIIKIGWVGVREYFIRRYSYIDNTPEEWLDLVPQNRQLKGLTMPKELINY